MLHAAGERPVNRGAVLRVYIAFHRLLWVIRLHHVPLEGCPTSNK